MIDDRQQALRGWAKFLNPEALRNNLITASIYLAAYEMLCRSAIDQIRSFFSNEFRDGKWIASEDYRNKCLVLHKKPLDASLLWLEQMSVIDNADLVRMARIRKHRNELAHELPKFLGTPDAEVNVNLLTDIYELVTKIDRWWIREVEMAIDPAPGNDDVADEDIVSGNMLFLHAMIQIATGEDSGAYWDEFQKQYGSVVDQPQRNAE